MIFVNPESHANKDIPNIALAYAATHFNVKVIDQNTKPYPKDRFLNYETDILGVSVRSLTYNEALRIAKIYKKRYPGAVVKSVKGFLDIQCCYPFIDFQDSIRYNESFSDAYPFPNYEVWDSIDIYRKNWSSGRWHYAIMTSQGCPYGCIYCVSRRKKWLARSAENCYEELKFAKERWGIKSFAILDDCFNIDKERVIRFCELVRPLNLKWICANGLRADRFDEDIAGAIASSGCKYVSFGVESTIPEVLKKIEKGETIDQIEKSISIAKKYMRGVNAFLIIGLPGSSYEDDLKSIEWVVKNQINAIFSFYVPSDETLRYNEVFYGEEARPLSDAYPKELQKRIFEMVKHMSIPLSPATVLKKAWGTVRLIWRFDREHAFQHFWENAERLFYKITEL